MAAEILTPNEDAIARAARLLSAGGLVAMPTETVYGLAADATNADAVACIYAAKDRPRFNPLIAHVAGMEMARAEGVFTGHAETLARAFWPGPLTLVLQAAGEGSVCLLARAGLPTIALRHPAHPVAAALIAALGRPLAAPSANPSGRLSPVSAEAVAQGLGERVGLILDGGPSRVGVESTVVDCSGGAPVVLRPGGTPHAAIEAALGGPVARAAGDPGAPTSPGQLLRHYAPRARLRLDATRAAPGEGHLGFAGIRGDLNLSPSGDLAEAAANLFAMLAALDKRFDAIAVAPVPETGLGEAINDRLRRAAER